MIVRRLAIGDRTALPLLLDHDASPHWVDQFHSMHGTAAGTTLVAEAAGKLVGAATCRENRYHPGRLSLAIDVRPDWRRMGIGSHLLAALRATFGHDEQRSFATKIFPGMDAGAQFVRHHGGYPYQTVPGFCFEPSQLVQWSSPESSAVSALTVEEEADRIAWFALLYAWIHETWSPVASLDVARNISLEILPDVDLELSFVGRIGTEPRFVAFAFTAGTVVEIVAESIDGRMVPGDLVRAVLGRVAKVAERRHVHRLEFDSHLTDPNLQPVLAHIPGATRQPVYLMSLPA